MSYVVKWNWCQVIGNHQHRFPEGKNTTTPAGDRPCFLQQWGLRSKHFLLKTYSCLYIDSGPAGSHVWRVLLWCWWCQDHHGNRHLLGHQHREYTTYIVSRWSKIYSQHYLFHLLQSKDKLLAWSLCGSTLEKCFKYCTFWVKLLDLLSLQYIHNGGITFNLSLSLRIVQWLELTAICSVRCQVHEFYFWARRTFQAVSSPLSPPFNTISNKCTLWPNKYTVIYFS